MDSRQRNRADAAAAIRADVVAAIATLGGEFDARIKELNRLLKSITDQQTVSRTVSEAEEILASAKRYDAEVKARVEDGLANLGKVSVKLDEREKSLEGREAVVRDAADNIKVRSELLEKREREFDARAANADIALNERAGRLSKSEAALATERAEVTALKRDLNDRLDKLRAA